MSSNEDPSASGNGISRFLEEYRIQHLLGGGRFGRVIRVTKMKNDHDYAMRILLVRPPSEEGSLENLKRNLDVYVTRIMPHANIVTHYANFIEEMKREVLDSVDELLNRQEPPENHYRKFFNVVHGQLSLSMLFVETELCKGDLRRFLKKPEAREHWTLRWCLQLLEQLALGLQHMHRFHLLHRNFRPENLFLAEEDYPNVVKIGDLDLVTFHGLNPVHARNLGCWPYLAPEQATTTNYGKPVDVYALGIVAFELLVCAEYHPTEAAPDWTSLRTAVRGFRDYKLLPPGSNLKCPIITSILFGLTENAPDKRMALGDLLPLLGSLSTLP